MSLAIGKEGQNARLSAKLTGWKIDIKSESQVEELRASGQYYDQEEYEDEYFGDYTSEEYEEGEYTEADWNEDSEEYSEYDYNDEYADQEGEYYQEGEAGEYNDYDENYEDDGYYDEQEGYDDGNNSETPLEAEDFGDQPEDSGQDDSEPEIIFNPEFEEPVKGKGKKAKKKSDSPKKAAKTGSKRKKLSVEEVGEYLEELEEDK